jgi:hypothetical protein
LRTVGVFKLACIAFFTVSAGPYGIEAAVQAAGAFPTLLGILVVAVFAGLPQSLLTAELSTMIPETGGFGA